MVWQARGGESTLTIEGTTTRKTKKQLGPPSYCMPSIARVLCACGRVHALVPNTSAQKMMYSNLFIGEGSA